MAIFLFLVLFAGILFATISTGELTLIITSILFGIFVVLNIFQEVKMHKLAKGKKLKRDINWGSMIVVYVCVVLFVIVAGLTIVNINNRVHSASTMGVISKIESDNNISEDSQETCTGYVKYKVDGKVYESKYESSSTLCNKKTGTRIKIYYRKDKPEKVTTTKNLVILVLATLFLGFCNFFVIKKAYKERRCKK